MSTLSPGVKSPPPAQEVIRSNLLVNGKFDAFLRILPDDKDKIKDLIADSESIPVTKLVTQCG